jgi:branched-chain amino acid aminotransferase
MPTNAKAGCLYPNNGRAIPRGASMRGFDNALVLDMLGNVAETGFLERLSWSRTASGLHACSPTARSCPASPAQPHDHQAASRAAGYAGGGEDAVGRVNSSTPTRYSRPATIPRSFPSPGSRTAILQPGPIAKKARELYWEWAHSAGQGLIFQQRKTASLRSCCHIQADNYLSVNGLTMPRIAIRRSTIHGF